jgi:nitrous oxide reductase
MSDLRLTLNGRVLDRRSFLGALSLTAAAAGSMLGGRLLQAAAGANGTASVSLEGVVGSWHVDDMWGHMPRYAHPISCHVMHVPMDLDNVHPADYAFVA